MFLVSTYKNVEPNAIIPETFSSELASDHSFALKTFEKDEFKALGLREYQFLKNLENHQNIIKVFNHSSSGMISNKSLKNPVVKSNEIKTYSCKNDKPFLEKGFDYMTMEYCPNGDLFDLIKKNGKLSEGLTKNIFLQLLNSLEFLHNKVGVAHLDLKLENILVGNNFEVKLCDFGFYEELSSKVCKNRGTHGYRAPETYL